MNWGLPYKGSKNRIVDQIVPLFPKRRHLYDLFCGGCAVSHFAMSTQRFQEIHLNDINPLCPRFFAEVLEGKYINDNRWISREDFYRLKDSDPFVAFVWSFGNNLRDYIYGRDVEPIKKALHYVLYFRDSSLADALGYDLACICQYDDINVRYRAMRRHLRDLEESKYRAQAYLASRRVREVQTFARLKMPESYTRQRRLRVLDAGNVSVTSGDYQSVEILPDSVIYCDIPYHGTSVYDKENAFDYERFYTWAESQSEPVFISEYWMPEDRFRCIKEIRHTSSICATDTKVVTERVFVPVKQKDHCKRQLDLFVKIGDI